MANFGNRNRKAIHPATIAIAISAYSSSIPTFQTQQRCRTLLWCRNPFFNGMRTETVTARAMQFHSCQNSRTVVRKIAFLLAILLICLSGGWGQAQLVYGQTTMALSLSSPAFKHNGEIPQTYTCEGLDISPPLEWTGVPAGTDSLALIIDDPDAPDPAAPKITWVHWILYNLPPSSTGLVEGIASRDLPAGTGVGLNNWNRNDFGGPCPPIGRHRYFHKLYALDRVLDLEGSPTKADVEAAMAGHILDRVELMGTYQKSR